MSNSREFQALVYDLTRFRHEGGIWLGSTFGGVGRVFADDEVWGCTRFSSKNSPQYLSF